MGSGKLGSAEEHNWKFWQDEKRQLSVAKTVCRDQQAPLVCAVRTETGMALVTKLPKQWRSPRKPAWMAFWKAIAPRGFTSTGLKLPPGPAAAKLGLLWDIASREGVAAFTYHSQCGSYLALEYGYQMLPLQHRKAIVCRRAPVRFSISLPSK